MAIGWMTVLQNVPWTDVVRNAPKVAAGAKKLWQSARASGFAGAVPVAEPEAGDSPTVMDPLAQLQAQVRELQVEVGDSAQRLQESSELINTLAEQNSQLVASVQALNRRVAWLSALAVLLGTATALLYCR